MVRVQVNPTDFWRFVELVSTLPPDKHELRMETMQCCRFYRDVREFVYREDVLFTFPTHEVCIEDSDLDFVFHQKNEFCMQYDETTDELLFPSITDLLFGIHEVGSHITRYHPLETAYMIRMFHLGNALKFIDFTVRLQELEEQVESHLTI